MRITLLFMTAVQILCKGQDVCQIFPRNPRILYGSNLTIFLKAPSSSNCRSKTPFNPSRIYWTLNKRKIDEKFYSFNSTFASVSIRNITVEEGTVECFLNSTVPILLNGTFIRTYRLVSSPQNVSCITKMDSDIPWPKVTCMWDHYHDNTDIKYTVHLKQNEEHSCESLEKKCTFPDYVRADLHSILSASVSAEDSYGNSAHSNEVTYSEVWATVQMDSPEDVVAEPLPTGLRVTWKIEQKEWVKMEETDCEIRLQEKGSYTEPAEMIMACSGTVELTDVKPCTSYTVSVRSRYQGSVWSTWSREVAALSYLNVSNLKFHLWRSKSVLSDRGKEQCTLCGRGKFTSGWEYQCVCPVWRYPYHLGKPSLPVSGYIIVWNSTARNHMWQQTLETSFTLKGEPFTLYTISLTPLYKDGPGNDITLHNCSQERHLTKVSEVQVTGVGDKHAEIHWLPIVPTQCCAFVLNYTVFYKAYNETETRNVTVGPNQNHVVLMDLQAKTAYSVYIMASTVAASSKSVPVIFSTKPNNQIFLIVIIACCAGLILLPMLAVTIQRKFLNKKIPDPQFSSLSMWPSDNCRKSWSLFSVPGVKDTEKILPCYVDNEGISVSPQSKKDMAIVKTLADIQNIATPETSQTENTPLAASFLNKGQLPFGDKEQRGPHVLALDLQNSGICPLPAVQSPYRKQTPLNSPVESLNQSLWSDEREVLLTPKFKNTTFFTSYVTLDMFEPAKHQTN